jgi:phosphoribosyl-AMP cyclohydrolase
MQSPIVLPTQIAERFSAGELVAAIAQDAQTKDVLMLAWMNKQALEQTLETGRITYWSRSRGELWEKGLTSGHTQKLVSIAFDCDADAILLQVHQVGAACHTGERSCFHNEIDTHIE